MDKAKFLKNRALIAEKVLQKTNKVLTKVRMSSGVDSDDIAISDSAESVMGPENKKCVEYKVTGMVNKDKGRGKNRLGSVSGDSGKEKRSPNKKDKGGEGNTWSKPSPKLGRKGIQERYRDCSVELDSSMVSQSEIEGPVETKRRSPEKDRPRKRNRQVLTTDDEDSEMEIIKGNRTKQGQGRARKGTPTEGIEGATNVQEVKRLGGKEVEGEGNQEAEKGRKALEQTLKEAAGLTGGITEICAMVMADRGPEMIEILSKVGGLNGIINKLILTCGILEGRLMERSTAEVKGGESKVTRRLESNQGRDRNYGIAKETPRTFAEALKGRKEEKVAEEKKGMTSKVKKLIQETVNKIPRSLVTITPAQGTAFSTHEEIKEALTKNFDPAKEKVGIRSLWKKGEKDLVIETETPEQLETILANEKLKKAGLIVKQATGNKPRLIIYDVPAEHSAEEIKQMIKEQNNIKEKQEMDFGLIYRTGPREQETVNWVIEASQLARERFLKNGRMNIGWRSCRVRDYLQISRCFRCQAQGHVAKYCKSENEICKHCAGSGHRASECPTGDTPATCASCKKIGKDPRHSVANKNCPAYQNALRRRAESIDYV